MEKHENTVFLTETRGADTYVSSSGEYILPDYNPDIRKILFTDCQLKPSGRLESDEQIDFAGVVEYKCIYSDKDGRLSCLNFTSDYEYSLPISEAQPEVQSLPSVQGYQIRVLGPRKISAKTSILCENIYTGEKRCAGEGTLPDGAELLCDKIKMARIKSFESEEREIAEEIARLDGVTLDEAEALTSLCECGETSFTREGDKLKAKSTVLVKMLYRDATGSVAPLFSEINAEGEIDISGVPEDAAVLCTPTLLSERCECLPTEDGVSVVADLIVKWDALCAFNEEHEIISDGYCTECETTAEYETLGYESVCEPISIELSADGRVAPEMPSDAKIKEVLCIAATPKISEKSVSGGYLTIALDLKIQGVVSYALDDGKVCELPVKFNENIDKKVKISSDFEDISCDAIKICECKIGQKIDGNDIKYSISVKVYILPALRKSARLLTSLEKQEEKRALRNIGRVTVYYTEPRDTLFSVAKKYATTVSRLIEDNEISAAASVGSDVKLPKRLIIY